MSLAAVSRILRGVKINEFSEETQKRVHKIAVELGWRPNLLVQGLQTGKTNTIGVFAAPFDVYWTGVLYGIHDKLLAAKRVPIVLWPNALVHPTVNRQADESTAGSSIRIGHSSISTGAGTADRLEHERLVRLIDRRVDAIITWPLFDQQAIDCMTQIGERGWPIVSIDDQLPGVSNATMVTTDESAAMRLAVDHLTEQGHRRIAFAGLDRLQAWCVRREAAFKACVPDGLVCHVETVGSAERPRIVELLRDNPDVTAVIASSDHLALQIIEAGRSLGRAVPADLAVIGYGNEVFDTSLLPLTSIDQQAYQIGQLAAKCALDFDVTAGSVVEVTPTLVARASTVSA